MFYPDPSESTFSKQQRSVKHRYVWLKGSSETACEVKRAYCISHNSYRWVFGRVAARARVPTCELLHTTEFDGGRARSGATTRRSTDRSHGMH